MRAVLVVTRSDYFWSHRAAVARAARRAGFEVHIVTQLVTSADDFHRVGLHVHDLRLPRGLGHYFRQVQAVAKLVRLYRRLEPAIVHHVSLQASLLGGMAARLARVPRFINAYTGLGLLATPGARRLAARLIWRAMRTVQPSNAVALFQNNEDLADCVIRRVVRPDRAVVIRGSGVDVRRFAFAEPSPEPIVMMAGRLIWPKGVREFAEAARLVRIRHPQIRFVVVGEPDERNSACCPRQWLADQVSRGHIEYWGRQTDMAELLQRAAIVVAPTWYGEGVPKVLLEAAATGRPMIATDIRGCREVVIPNRTGIRVAPRDARQLALAVTHLWHDEALRAAMGRAARELVVTHFSDAKVAERTIKLYKSMLESPASAQQLRRRPRPTSVSVTTNPSPMVVGRSRIDKWV